MCGSETLGSALRAAIEGPSCGELNISLKCIELTRINRSWQLIYVWLYFPAGDPSNIWSSPNHRASPHPTYTPSPSPSPHVGFGSTSTPGGDNSSISTVMCNDSGSRLFGDVLGGEHQSTPTTSKSSSIVSSDPLPSEEFRKFREEVNESFNMMSDVLNTILAHIQVHIRNNIFWIQHNQYSGNIFLGYFINYFIYVWEQGQRKRPEPDVDDPQTKYPKIKLPLNNFQEIQSLDTFLDDTGTEQYQDLVSTIDLLMFNFKAVDYWIE